MAVSLFTVSRLGVCGNSAAILGLSVAAIVGMVTLVLVIVFCMTSNVLCDSPHAMSAECLHCLPLQCHPWSHLPLLDMCLILGVRIIARRDRKGAGEHVVLVAHQGFQLLLTV